MNSEETIADILREMRNMSKCGGLCFVNDAGMADIADRIEAAEKWERENTIYAGRNGEMTLDECITRCDNNSGNDPRGRDVEQIGGWLRELRDRRSATGNAAAMRGALEIIRDALKDREQDGLTEPRDILERHIVEKALAAPVRNCDRYPNWETALPAWAMETGEEVDSKTGFLDNAQLKRFLAWLFAPAEGGAPHV